MIAREGKISILYGQVSRHAPVLFGLQAQQSLGQVLTATLQELDHLALLLHHARRPEQEPASCAVWGMHGTGSHPSW